MTGKGYILHIILTRSPSEAFYGAFMEIMSELYHQFTLVGLGGVFENPPAGGRVERACRVLRGRGGAVPGDTEGAGRSEFNSATSLPPGCASLRRSTFSG